MTDDTARQPAGPPPGLALDELMATREAAAYLGISVQAVNQAARRRKLPVAIVKFSTLSGQPSRHFRRYDLDAYAALAAVGHPEPGGTHDTPHR